MTSHLNVSKPGEGWGSLGTLTLNVENECGVLEENASFCFPLI